MNNGGSASLIELPETPQLDVELTISGAPLEALRHWQVRPGEIVTVCDPQQGFYRARLLSVAEGQARLLPFARLSRAESPLQITVLQALPDKERFELVLQKLTELGVVRIVPYVSSRSATLAERDAGQKKSHRWPDVLLRAARQCRRGIIPELYPVLDFSQALELAASCELALLCYEGEAGWSLAESLKGFRGCSVSLMVGPEGGFTTDEVALATGAGVLPISIGPRILRTETAAILAAGLVQFALGDLGQSS